MAQIDEVFIDSSELFPFTIMDVLLTLAEQFVFTWVWTDELLAEWERAIVETKHRTPESAKSVTNAVRAYFASGLIELPTYIDDSTDDLSPDPGDRFHVAACVGGRATVLLTRNLKDFAAPALAQSGVRVLTADDYLIDLLHRPASPSIPRSRRRSQTDCGRSEEPADKHGGTARPHRARRSASVRRSASASARVRDWLTPDGIRAGARAVTDANGGGRAAVPRRATAPAR